MADGRRFEKKIISIISSVNYPISIKFGVQMRMSNTRMDIWRNIEILQIQDGGRTPYWKSFLAISQRHILAD